MEHKVIQIAVASSPDNPDIVYLLYANGALYSGYYERNQGYVWQPVTLPTVKTDG
jgi:hypothetical protein